MSVDKLKAELEDLRKRIDGIDQRIVAALEERIEVARRIGEIKRAMGLPIYDPERERKVFLKVISQLRGVLSPSMLLSIYKEIVSVARYYQQPLKIAFLGPEGTYTHQAAWNVFGSWVAYVPVSTIKRVFQEVEKGRAHMGVVPVENSTEGVVNRTLDMLVDSPLKIAGEFYMEISHNLISKEKSLSEIKIVFSHPQAIAQCSSWLEENLPHASIRETESTSQAAKMARELPGAAAIASRMAAHIYGLNVLAENIEDMKGNTTRFLLLSKFGASSGEKTSIICSLRDRVGALRDLLSCFADEGINLTKIESRPARDRPWSYVFFIDFEGKLGEPRVEKALSRSREQCVFMKLLGTYPTLSAVSAGAHGGEKSFSGELFEARDIITKELMSFLNMSFSKQEENKEG